MLITPHIYNSLIRENLINTEMTEHSNNNQAKHIQANQQLGIIGSSLEHQVLEQLFAQNGEQAFSAVKAIQLANEQGQKIYTITKNNYHEVLPKLQLAQHAKDDIKNAAQAGLTITTHEKRITLNGYTGEGYIILNERGGGAYMIGGGLYGAALILIIGGLAVMYAGLWLGFAEVAGPMTALAALGIGALLATAGAFLFNGKREWCAASLFAAVTLFKKYFFTRFFGKKLPLGLTLLGVVPGSKKILDICGCLNKPYCLGIPSLDPWDYIP